jgi:hypothetical protein
MAKYQIIKATTLPSTLQPNTVYYVKGASDTETQAFVTNSATSGTQAFPLTGTALRTSGDTGIGALRYAGTTKTIGQLYGGSSTPTNTRRLNYDGNFVSTRSQIKDISSHTALETTVTTSDVIISDEQTLSGALHIVSGLQSANEFTDLVLQHGTSFTVISSVNVGSPTTRTYSVSVGGDLRLRMSSGTYGIKCITLANFGGVF